MKIKIPPFVVNIIKTFLKADHEIYIVGGAVRDLIMERPVNDWDFTTSASPEIILSLFPNAFYNNKFGTVGVTNPDEEQKPGVKLPVYEITTFRKETSYSDYRHPDQVSWGQTLEEDLVRRDLTINAMAFRPHPKCVSWPNCDSQNPVYDFELIDPHGGQEDIKMKLIRAVGDPNQRFKEDALRMMRTIRIATQLAFTVEDNTFQAVRANLDLLAFVSGERIRDELLKLLSYPHAADGYLLLRNSGIAVKILPELERGFGVDQKSLKRHHLFDVGTHNLMSLHFCKSSSPLVKLATLLHDVGKPVVVQKLADGTITFYNHEVVGASLVRIISRRLHFSKKDEDRLFTLVRWHQFTVDERQTDKAIRRFIRNVGMENLDDMLALRTADRLGGGAKETSWRLERFKNKLIEVQKQPFSINDLKIDGRDIMKELNINPGPMVGTILNLLFDEVVEKKVKNTRTLLLQRIKQFPLPK